MIDIPIGVGEGEIILVETAVVGGIVVINGVDDCNVDECKWCR